MSSTRTHTLSEVEFTEIIQVNHIETRLKKNFQIIVDELSRKGDEDTRRDSDLKHLQEQLAAMKEQITQLSKTTNNYVTKEQLQHDRTEILKYVVDRDNNLRNDLADTNSSGNKINPELVNTQPATSEATALHHNILNERMMKTESLLDNLREEIAKLKNSLSETNKTVKNHQQLLDQHTKDIEDLKKSSGKVKTEPRPMTVSNDDGEVEKTLQDLSTKISDIEKSTTDLSDHIKEKDKVIQLHTKYIWDLNYKVFALDKNNADEHKTFQESSETMKKLIDGGLRPRSAANDIDTRLRDLERKADLLLQNNDVLSKGVRVCEEEIETLVTQMNSSRNMTSLLHAGYDNSKDLDRSDLKRYLLLKLGDQRREYMTLLKGLMNIKNADSQDEKDRLLEYSITELKHQVNKKADEYNTRKAVVFLEKKINYIFNTFLNMSEDDARIGRKNWFCLSCDRKLTSFTGKVGYHLPSPGPKGTKLSTTIAIDKLNAQDSTGLINSRYKSKSKLDLPTLQTTAAKRN